MTKTDREYARALSRVVMDGEHRPDRTGTGATEVFGLTMEFNLALEFPILSGKRVSFRNVAKELLWFIHGGHEGLWGDYSLRREDLGCKIWDEWESPTAEYPGDMGPIYGAQWRHWGGDEVDHDQLASVISGIKADPYSRRHIIATWNPTDIPDMALPPCHGLVIQFYVHESGRLDLQMYQRSGDMFLGVPYNITSYALLLEMVAKVTGLRAGKLRLVIGCAHIYDNHKFQVREYLSRVGKMESGPIYYGSNCTPVSILVAYHRSIDSFQLDDFELMGYNPLPAIKAPVAV